MTDRDLILRWLEFEQHNRGRQPGTAKKYLAYVQRLEESLAAKGKTLLTADRDDLEAFTGPEAHQSGLRPGSRRPVVAAIRGFYAWARRAGLLQDNPAEVLPYPKASRRLPKGMGLANAEALMMAPDLDTFLGVRDAAILSVFIGCGLRLSGLVGLNQSNLIWAKGEKGEERLVLRVVEKGDKERYLPAPHETRLYLRMYLGHPELAAIDRHLPSGDQVLFVSTNARTVPPHQYYGEARRISVRGVAEIVVKYGQIVGIPRAECSPHKLRHLYGTELAEDDVQMNKIQTLMGHADPKTTKDYVHVALRSLARAVDQANPFAKMRTPVTELAKRLAR